MKSLYVIDICVISLYQIIMTALQTVVELTRFVKQAKAIMSDEECRALVDYIAANPEAGVPLGGGLRKVRIAREGAGKSGGYRTLFVFGGMHMPLFLVGVFAKNDKGNLTKAEQAHLVQLAKTLLATYQPKRRENDDE
jgi:hypothetical protein